MNKIRILNFILLGALIFINLVKIKTDRVNLAEIKKEYIKYNLISCQNLKIENQYLHQMLALKPKYPTEIMGLGYFESWYQKIIINRGWSDGVKLDNMVLSGETFIGMVTAVQKHWAVVTLLEHLNRTISVKVNDKYGVLTSQRGHLILKGFSTSDLKIGAQVYTSGLTKLKGDLLIGSISHLKANDQTFETTAELRPRNDYHHFKYLLVIDS